MKARFAGRLYISKSLPFFLGVRKPRGDQGLGPHIPRRAPRLHARATVAFGDGENDVELLQWAAFGVAVANAHPRVLEVADWVCPSAEEEGVAQVIEALLDSRA